MSSVIVSLPPTYFQPRTSVSIPSYLYYSLAQKRKKDLYGTCIQIDDLIRTEIRCYSSRSDHRGSAEISQYILSCLIGSDIDPCSFEISLAEEKEVLKEI